MLVINHPREITESIGRSSVTIGNFDGVHLGHRKLIDLTVAKAKAQGLTSVVVTFDPHPLRVLVGDKTPPFITTTRQKLGFIAELGVQVALVVPFDKPFAAVPPEDFVQRYLVDGLRVRELIIGYDYSFGKGRRGNFELLRNLGLHLGFAVERLDPLIIDGAIVSSTRIRDLVQSGKVWEARNLLGRFHQLAGRVIHGKDRGGRLLGFPTANLALTGELVPQPGVYAVWAAWASQDGSGLQIHPAVANVGYNPTFGDVGLSVEVYVMDFEGDLYNQDMTVHFVQRIRSERKFDSLDELIGRIKDDVELGRRILSLPDVQP